MLLYQSAVPVFVEVFVGAEESFVVLRGQLASVYLIEMRNLASLVGIGNAETFSNMFRIEVSGRLIFLSLGHKEIPLLEVVLFLEVEDAGSCLVVKVDFLVLLLRVVVEICHVGVRDVGVARRVLADCWGLVELVLGDVEIGELPLIRDGLVLSPVDALS